MKFLRCRKLTIDGHEFEVREVSIAMRREIEAAQSQGADHVAETLKRCVFYDGEPLGDDAVNLGYSFATRLVQEITDLAGLAVPVPVHAETAAADPAPVANGNGEAVAVPKD